MYACTQYAAGSRNLIERSRKTLEPKETYAAAAILSGSFFVIDLNVCFLYKRLLCV
jgi:hypothetical protein